MHDYRNNVKHTESILPQVFSGNTPTDTQGIGVFVAAFRVNVAKIHLGLSGDVLAAGLKVAMSLMESDDTVTGLSNSGTWTTVDDADVVCTLEDGTVQTAVSNEFVCDDPAEDEKVYILEYRGSKKAFAPYLNFTGNHATGIPIHADIEQFEGDVPAV